MSRAVVILRSKAERERVSRWATTCPTGTRVEFKEAKRSLDQNAKMWSMLTEIAQQKDHFGSKLTPDTWKVLFMHACGNELKVERSLDGEELVPVGGRSSDLSKGEMSDLIAFMLAWGAENGVRFANDKEDAA